MWLGLTHHPGGDAVLVAYQPDRIFTVGTTPDALPSLIGMLRAAAGLRAREWEPRCRACGEPLDVPPLDAP